MEAEAKTRKERLLKLKQKASQTDAADTQEKPILKFRNFQPTSETLLSISGASAPKESREEPSVTEESNKRPNEGISNHPTVEKVVEGISEAVILEQKKKFKEEVVKAWFFLSLTVLELSESRPYQTELGSQARCRKEASKA
ncbi:hypothetical protein DSO57_1014440 [Entomophthora muscae]|uniref:Uncharacterized protein n=1 Tax=Entomophthora muscae TaxID=34485 RepID=A0ACC2RK04_9FUNG|nr:hypothetical protein DSO57_1014440 [Entomophthora muscae]